MRFRTACLLPVLLSVAPFAQAQAPAPQNLDFEQGELGQLPPGWFCPTAGYKAELTDQKPKQGQQCVHLFRQKDAQQPAPFGNLMQSVDATPYRGKTVRFRAAVRVIGEQPTDRAQLWLRIDRPNRQMGFFDNMDDRPIENATWQYYEIVGDVADDAEYLNIGCMLVAAGELWLDDVSLEPTGSVLPAAGQPPRPLEGRALDNLVAFTRLLGYVRYFHPSDEAAATDWDDFAVRGVHAVERAQDPHELARRLGELLAPVAPSVTVFPTADAGKLPASAGPPEGVKDLRIAAWKHLGVGLGSAKSIYHSERIFRDYEPGKLPEGFADPSKPFVAELAGGVSCRVPLAVFADAEHTLPRAENAADTKKPTSRPSGNDRATRLADVALVWNVFQHFFPYFDVVQTDWPAVLRSSLTRTATDKDERAFLDTLRLLVAELHDGHGYVSHPSDPATGWLPLAWDWIEDRLVITATGWETQQALKDGGPLEIGDIVIDFNGRPVREALADAERYVPAATPPARRRGAVARLARGVPGEAAALKLEAADGTSRTATLRYSAEGEPLKEPRPERITELRPGIMYVDLDRITDDDFNAAVPQLERARGIVFDLRGYPRVSTVVISHLTSSQVTSARWNVPVVRLPDRAGLDFEFRNWTVPPVAPKFAAKFAFVTDSRAISYAETYLGIIEHYKLAEIVGEATAGTNGNINPFTLPGGYGISWTGMKVLKQDGSQHHGVGIKPTVAAARTIAGVRAGQDEFLAQAIDTVAPK